MIGTTGPIYAFVFAVFALLIVTVWTNMSGMFYTSMLTRMFHWDLGLLDSMYSTLMIGDYAVVLHQIVNGRPRLATYVLLPSIGHAVGFAGLQIGSKRSTGGVGKVNMLCGALPFRRRRFTVLPDWEHDELYEVSRGNANSI